MRFLAFWVLLLAAGMSGCTTDDGNGDAAPVDGVEPESPVDPVPAKAACTTATNYGVMISVDGTVVYTGPGGAQDMRVYEDDNGFSGLQTEETCPDNHDTRVV